MAEKTTLTRSMAKKTTLTLWGLPSSIIQVIAGMLECDEVIGLSSIIQIDIGVYLRAHPFVTFALKYEIPELGPESAKYLDIKTSGLLGPMLALGFNPYDFERKCLVLDTITPESRAAWSDKLEKVKAMPEYKESPTPLLIRLGEEETIYTHQTAIKVLGEDITKFVDETDGGYDHIIFAGGPDARQDMVNINAWLTVFKIKGRSRPGEFVGDRKFSMWSATQGSLG